MASVAAVPGAVVVVVVVMAAAAAAAAVIVVMAGRWRCDGVLSLCRGGRRSEPSRLGGPVP